MFKRVDVTKLIIIRKLAATAPLIANFSIIVRFYSSEEGSEYSATGAKHRSRTGTLNKPFFYTSSLLYCHRTPV